VVSQGDEAREFTTGELDLLKRRETQLRQFTPEMTDIFSGMADGATDAGIPLSYHDILAHFVGRDFSSRSPGAPPSGQGEIEPVGCSGFAGLGSTTRDGRLICASNGDDQINYFSTTLVVFPESGHPFICSPFNVVAFGGSPVIGDEQQGARLCSSRRRNFRQRNHGQGHPQGIAALHTLRFAQSADEALEMQLAYPRGIKAGGLWADVDGNAFCIECRDPEAVRRPGYLDEKDFIFASNNCLCRELGCEGETYVPHAGWLGTHLMNISSIPRNREMWNMLHSYQGEVGMDFCPDDVSLSGPAAGLSYSERSRCGLPGNERQGLEPEICNLLNAVVCIAVPDRGENGSYRVCAGCAAG